MPQICRGQYLAGRVRAFTDAITIRASPITSQWSTTWTGSTVLDPYSLSQERRSSMKSRPVEATSVTSSVVFPNGFEE